MYINSHPLAPRNNPRIEEGVYDAAIEKLENKTYGEDDSPMVRIVFRIPSKQVYFVSHIYFPGNYSPGAQQRLWHFCRCVGLDSADVGNNPDAFQDRWLRLSVIEYAPKAYAPYCDVQAFHPSEPELEEPEGPEDWGLDCDWVHPLGFVV